MPESTNRKWEGGSVSVTPASSWKDKLELNDITKEYGALDVVPAPLKTMIEMSDVLAKVLREVKDLVGERCK